MPTTLALHSCMNSPKHYHPVISSVIDFENNMKFFLKFFPVLFLVGDVHASGGFSYGLILYGWYILVGGITTVVFFGALILQTFRRVKNSESNTLHSSITIILIGSITSIIIPLFSYIPCLFNPSSQECAQSNPGIDVQGEILLINLFVIFTFALFYMLSRNWMSQ